MHDKEQARFDFDGRRIGDHFVADAAGSIGVEGFAMQMPL
jgi:hypothetical protein